MVFKKYNPAIGRFEFVDENENRVFDETYKDSVGGFLTLGGVVAVCDDKGKWGFISESGATVVPFMFNEEDIKKIINSAELKFDKVKTNKTKTSCICEMLLLNDKTKGSIDTKLIDVVNVSHEIENGSLRKNSKKPIVDGVCVKKIRDGEYTFADEKGRQLLQVVLNSKEMIEYLKNMYSKIKEPSKENATTTAAEGLATIRIIAMNKDNYSQPGNF